MALRATSSPNPEGGREGGEGGGREGRYIMDAPIFFTVIRFV